jgi:hypothetical protein
VLAQALFYVNRPPRGGSLRVSPMAGTALTTNFTVTARGWADPEGHLPLRYAYSLSDGGDSTLLHDAGPDTQIWVRSLALSLCWWRGLTPPIVGVAQTSLASGSGMAVVVTVTDSYGATNSTAVRGLTVLPLSLSASTALLSSALSVLAVSGNTSSPISDAVFSQYVLTAAELGGKIQDLTSGTNASVISGVVSGVISLFSGLASQRGTLGVELAETLVTSLNKLIEPAPAMPQLSEAQQYGALSVVRAVSGKLTGLSDSLGTSMVSGLSSLVQGGILTSDSCQAFRPDEAVDGVLGAISAMALDKVTAADSGVSYRAGDLGEPPHP